jgi:hypothetical protein
MAHNLTFYGWQRSGVYDLAPGTLEEGRLQASVEITLQNRENPAEQVTRSLDFLIAGPPDISGILPGAITVHYPPANSTNAETTKFPYLEFKPTDLPWRYSPELASGDSLRPWIVLVVGTPQDVQLEANQMVTLTTAAQDDHDLTESARWAHVQDDGGRVCSRVLSPKELTADQEWVAALVPAFNDAGDDSWDGSGSVVLPCYHFWHFRTSALGDFRTLASKLKPGVADPELGRAPLHYPRVEPVAELHVRGALAPIGGSDAALDADVEADVAELLTPLIDPRGRPVVSLPRYGEPWAPDPSTVPWGAAANGDPRHRGTAGLGLWAGIELQDTIVDAAADQVGALDIAEQRIRQLSLGLAAVRSLWNRRLPSDPAQRLQLYGPSMRRMPAAGGSVLDAISGAGRPLPPRLFSSAARRVLRPGPARTALADPQANRPDRVLDQANTCPRPPERVVDGLPHGDLVSKIFDLPSLEELADKDPSREGLQAFLERFIVTVEESEFLDLLEQIVEFVRERFEEPESLPLLVLLEILIAINNADKEELGRLVETFPFEPEEPEIESLVDFARGLSSDPPKRPCRPVDLTQLEETLTASIDPTVDQPLVVRRVLAGISGLDMTQPLAPVEVCVGLDLPVWTFLRDQAPDWLLPGVNSLEEDAVVGMESNPTFVDAFLLGLNTQVLSELRWRNLRIATGCTPMRTFWGQIDLAGDRSMPDIRGVDIWSDDSTLGDPSHQPPPVTAANDLVLVFRSDLFRRYPNTLVYAAPVALDGGEPDWEAEPPFGDGDRLYPTFQGSIGEDITFFRFELQPVDAREYWIALEEPPSGYSFRNDAPVAEDVNDGANFADLTFSNPTRVLIRGESLIPAEV